MKLHLPYLFLIAIIVLSLFSAILAPHPETWGITNIVVSAALILSGAFLGVWAKQTLQDSQTPVSPYATPTALVTEPPFQFTRNPMYFSYVIVAIGFVTLSRSLIGLLLTILYFFYLDSKVIRREEEQLQEVFKNQYAEYAGKIRRWV